MGRPRVDSPTIPDGYGASRGGPYLKWPEVERTLIGSLHYWLATTRPDGRPHAVPRWGVWLDGRFWYDGAPETRHVQNLGPSGPCVLHLESGESATIAEGTSSTSGHVTGELGGRLSAEFGRKYAALGYAPTPDAWSGENAGGLRVFSPTKVIAWSEFPKDLTRFTFE